jgi:hypothetical protein
VLLAVTPASRLPTVGLFSKDLSVSTIAFAKSESLIHELSDAHLLILEVQVEMEGRDLVPYGLWLGGSWQHIMRNN